MENIVDSESAAGIIISPAVNAPESDFINDLNDDCLSEIFSYLPLGDKFTIQAVCQRWRKNPQLAWQDMKCLDLMSIDLLGLSFWKRGKIEEFFRRCGPFLQHLRIGATRRTVILPLISVHCHNLTKVTITLGSHDVIRADWFVQMVRLEHLEMRGSNQHFSKMFFHTLPHENLKELHLSAIPPQVYLSPGTVRVFTKFTKLSALTLDGFILSPKLLSTVRDKLNSTALLITIRNVEEKLPDVNLLSKVTHLSLSKLIEVNGDYLKLISETCKSLKQLDLSGCVRIDNNAIVELHKLPQLEELYLNSINGVTDEPLRNMHNLRRLECYRCFRVNNNGIITLMMYAPNLEHLNLLNSGVTSIILAEAREIVRRRTNGIKLELVVSFPILQRWNKLDGPHLLDVTCSWRGDVVYHNNDASDSDYDTPESSSDSDDSCMDITDDCSSDSPDTSDTGDSDVMEIVEDAC